MLLIGSHVSFRSNDQLVGSVKEALSYGSNCFMFYTGAPQNTKRCKLDYDLTVEARNLLYENNIELKNIIIHAPYIINLANNEKEESYRFSINFLKDEINRASMLGVEKIVLHPGSFVNLDLDKGINNVINALNEVITYNQEVKLCLETMAGKGSEICYKLEHIKRIIDGVRYSDKLMVCLDTCHLHDAGYDLTHFDDLLKEFDQKIGLDRLLVVHVNDSKNERGAHKDRHENIGYGYIGFDTLNTIVHHPQLKDVPKILETPYIDGKAPYREEINMFVHQTFNNGLK